MIRCWEKKENLKTFSSWETFIQESVQMLLSEFVVFIRAFFFAGCVLYSG